MGLAISVICTTVQRLNKIEFAPCRLIARSRLRGRAERVCSAPRSDANLFCYRNGSRELFWATMRYDSEAIVPAATCRARLHQPRQRVQSARDERPRLLHPLQCSQWII